MEPIPSWTVDRSVDAPRHPEPEPEPEPEPTPRGRTTLFVLLGLVGVSALFTIFWLGVLVGSN